MIKIVPFPEEAKGVTVYRPTDPHPIYTPDNDVRLLIWLAKETLGNILEIGCCEGATTFNLGLRFPKRHIAAVDWTGPQIMCDNQQREQPTKTTACRFADWLPNVHFFDMDAAVAAFGLAYGFIFIDGDHRYHPLAKDTNLAQNHINSGGIIAWHDYPVEHRGPKADWIGVPRLLNELSDGGMEIQACEGTMVAWTRVP